MNDHISIYQLIAHASLLVQGVMVLLGLASLWSWAVIFGKYLEFQATFRAVANFEERFWSGIDLSELYKQISAATDNTGLEILFRAGFKEYVRLHQQVGVQPTVVVESTSRAMRVALTRELDELDARLPILATVGSVSPYIGLFGTVWGIMQSFRSLSTAHQATLSAVAPGIAEALVATAIGLFAAIPAVVAYNYFVMRIERLSVRYEAFMEEFANLLARQVHSR